MIRKTTRQIPHPRGLHTVYEVTAIDGRTDWFLTKRAAEFWASLIEERIKGEEARRGARQPFSA